MRYLLQESWLTVIIKDGHLDTFRDQFDQWATKVAQLNNEHLISFNNVVIQNRDSKVGGQ